MAADWEDDAYETGEDAGSGGGGAGSGISQEDQQALDWLKKSGISPAEAAARARQHLEAEQGAGGRGDQAEDENGPVSRGELKRIVAEVGREARLHGEIDRISERIEERVASFAQSERGFGKKLPANRLDGLVDQVKSKVRENPEFKKMGAMEFWEAVDSAVGEVFQAEKSWAAELTGGEAPETTEHARRSREAAGTDGQARKTAAGKRGGGGDQAPRDPDEQMFGVGQRFPTEAEAEAAFQEDLRAFQASQARR